MKHFPIFSIEDFYDNVDEVREFALAQEYTAPPKGEYPGTRTKLLHELDAEFTDQFCRKIFSLFYNFNNEIINWNISTCFHKITPYNNPRANVGWTHMDDHTVLAGLIYLTPDANLDSGTSVCAVKRGEKPNPDYRIKCNFYTNKSTDVDGYVQHLEEHNNKFNETIEFKNVYNTLIAYPGNLYHRANNFDCGKGERLTQLFSFSRIHAEATPMERLKGLN